MNNYIGQLHVYTISHMEANVNIRESFSISKNQAELIYEKINNYNINELFILSTCNRTEFYAVCKDRDSLGLTIIFFTCQLNPLAREM